MPRLIPGKHCPHCRAELPEPKLPACGECGGSLNQRFLKAGCLSSAPVLLALGSAWWAVWRLLG